MNKPSSNQEAFEIAVEHMLKQGHRSMLGNRCTYRGEHGDMCAVGALIPDSMYTPDIEGYGIYELLGAPIPGTDKFMFQEFRDLFDGVDIDILYRLQEIHDQTCVESWYSELKFLSREIGLEWPERFEKIQSAE